MKFTRMNALRGYLWKLELIMPVVFAQLLQPRPFRMIFDCVLIQGTIAKCIHEGTGVHGDSVGSTKMFSSYLKNKSLFHQLMVTL
jgi:hypothetical protein